MLWCSVCLQLVHLKNLYTLVRCTSSSSQTLLSLGRWKNDILKVSRYQILRILFCFSSLFLNIYFKITLNINFTSLQDCKEFQGELFGISNLFRDLSDKLFTGEIIELHEEHGHETEQPEEVNLSEEETSSSVLESETRLCNKSVRDATSKPDLVDLGMFHIS